MEILLTIIHLAACFILIVIVLLQKGKGADLAGAFGGGGSQQTMGVRSATQIIHKLTIAAAVFFMITSFTLGLSGNRRASLIRGLGNQTEQTQTEGETQPADESEAPATEQPEEAEDQGEGEDATTPEPDADNPSGADEEEAPGDN